MIRKQLKSVRIKGWSNRRQLFKEGNLILFEIAENNSKDQNSLSRVAYIKDKIKEKDLEVAFTTIRGKYALSLFVIVTIPMEVTDEISYVLQLFDLEIETSVPVLALA